MPKKNKKSNPQNDFVTLTSHQLRTPLSSMKWLLELLQKKRTGKLNTKQKQFVEKLYTSNERMIALVDDLLEVSRLESGDVKFYLHPTDLSVVVRTLIREKAADIKKKHLLVTVTIEQEPFPQVMTEPVKIKQALANIINNAIIFAPDSGKIQISLKVSGSSAMAIIRDDGPGIPGVEQRQVFRKFFRGSNVRNIETNGSGLGLYISKAIIEASKGKIWFESKPGKGTTFYFSIPLMPPK